MYDAPTKSCPWCGETILAVAKKCKHCGEFLTEVPVPSQLPRWIDKLLVPPVVTAALIVSFAALGIGGVLRTRSEQGSASMTSEAPPVMGPVVLRDSFGRPDTAAGLGSIPGGPPWRAIAGSWGIERGQAHVSIPDHPASIAVADTGRTSDAIAVTLSVVRRGAGLVFRFRDPGNYWAVTAAPAYGTWVVAKFIDGKMTIVTNIGLAALGNGTRVHIDQRDDSLQVWVDAAGRTTSPRRVHDSFLRDARGAGMYVETGATDARFAQFVVSR